MSEQPSGSFPTPFQRTVSADLYLALQLDPLLSATRLGLLPSSSYDEAWDAIEEQSPRRYQPADHVADWLRAHWSNALAGDVIPTIPTISADVHAHEPKQAKPWMATFLAAYRSNGGRVRPAAQVAGVHRDTVYRYVGCDPAFAAAFHAERAGDVRHSPTV